MNGTIFTNSMRNELPSTVRNSFALHQLKIYVKDELLSLFEITAPNYSNKRVKCLKKQYGYCTTYFVSNCTLSGPYIDCSCIDLHSSDDFDKITPTKKKNETS